MGIQRGDSMDFGDLLGYRGSVSAEFRTRRWGSPSAAQSFRLMVDRRQFLEACSAAGLSGLFPGALYAQVAEEDGAEASPITPDHVAAAETIAAADACVFGWTLGLTEHSHGTENVMAMANLAAVTGNLGKPGAGVSPFRGQNNVQGGGGDMGTLPGSLPGYQNPADDEVGEKFADAWGERPPEEPGLKVPEMLAEAHAGNLRGMYVVGENPALSEPDIQHAAEALEDLEFLVVQDIFMTETAEYADVILPATTWAERGGTVTNTDRRVQRMRGLSKVHENTRHDLEILCEIGSRLFGEGFDFEDPEEVFEELREVCPIMHGMTYDALGEEGIQWPCYEEGDEGDQYLYEDSFETANGLGHIEGVVHQEPKETPDEEYPLVLTTARLVEHYNTGTMSRRSPTLSRQHPENFVDIHPADADRYGIEDGDYVRLKSRRGQIELKAQVTEDIKEGVVWTTPHFAAASANRLTNDVLDERAKIPEYKAAAAEIEVGIEPAEQSAAGDD